MVPESRPLALPCRPGHSGVMAVDVTVEVRIERPVRAVAAYAGDPANAPTWNRNIDSVVWRTDPPVAVGSRLDFVAHFLGRRLAYTYEVRQIDPDRRMVMGSTEGPLPMTTTYGWEPVDEGTRMTLRNQGDPSGFGAMGAPLLSRAVRRATRRDLARLKALLERPSP